MHDGIGTANHLAEAVHIQQIRGHRRTGPVDAHDLVAVRGEVGRRMAADQAGASCNDDFQCLASAFFPAAGELSCGQ